MLSVFFLLLWQSFCFVLSLLVFNQNRTVRQLIIPAVVVLQVMQELSPYFSAFRWMDRGYLSTMVMAAQVGGYAWLFIRYIKNFYVALFTKMLTALQGFLIILIVILPPERVPDQYRMLVILDAVAILVPILFVLFQLIQNPPPASERNSFPPILWIACGLLFYFLIAGFMGFSNEWFPEFSQLSAMVSWNALMRIVQNVGLYLFFTVAFVICLMRPPQTL